MTSRVAGAPASSRPVGAMVPLLARVSAVLTVGIGAVSLGSYRTGHEYRVVSQFGEVVEVFGFGVHARDSVLKAGIVTGADAICALVGAPLLLWFAGRVNHPEPDRARRARLRLAALLGVFAYYALSGATTQTYNVLLLPFCVVTAASLFGCFALVLGTDLDDLATHHTWRLPWRSMTVFLVLGAAAVTVAWLPDIVLSWFAGPPESLEVYHTEITYALDLAIVGPLIIAGVVLLRRRTGLGLVLVAASLVACITVGLQTLAGIVLLQDVYAQMPVAQVLTKIVVFVVLGGWGLVLDRRLFAGQR